MISLRTVSAFSKYPSSPRAFAFLKSALELASFLLRACKNECAKVVLLSFTNLVSSFYCSFPVPLFDVTGGHVCVYFLEHFVGLSIEEHWSYSIRFTVPGIDTSVNSSFAPAAWWTADVDGGDAGVPIPSDFRAFLHDYGLHNANEI